MPRNQRVVGRKGYDGFLYGNILPSVEGSAGISEVNDIFVLADVHAIGEAQGLTFNLCDERGG